MVRIFPNPASWLRLVRALCAEASLQTWSGTADNKVILAVAGRTRITCRCSIAGVERYDNGPNVAARLPWVWLGSTSDHEQFQELFSRESR